MLQIKIAYILLQGLPPPLKKTFSASHGTVKLEDDIYAIYVIFDVVIPVV